AVLAFGHAMQGRGAEAAPIADRALAAFAPAGRSGEFRHLPHLSVAAAYFSADRFADCLHACATGRDLCDRQPWLAWNAPSLGLFEALVSFSRGSLLDAEALIHAAIAQADEIQTSIAVPWMWAVAGCIASL